MSVLRTAKVLIVSPFELPYNARGEAIAYKEACDRYSSILDHLKADVVRVEFLHPRGNLLRKCDVFRPDLIILSITDEMKSVRTLEMLLSYTFTRNIPRITIFEDEHVSIRWIMEDDEQNEGEEERPIWERKSRPLIS
jgi:hypothetical protein